jgi:hypothetical protein
MNQRLKELAKQADEYASQFAHLGAIDHPSHIDKFNQKFAELIVQECATIIDDIPSSPLCSWSDGYYEGCRDSAKQIKQHFGVEQ